MVLRGCVWAGAKFLKPWQVTDKIIEWIFKQFTFNILWVTLTQKIITHRVSTIHDWFWGDMYESGKVLKPWQVTHKIIEWIFSQFTFNIFMNDSNSKNNNLQGFENSWMDMRGCLWVGEISQDMTRWQIKKKKMQPQKRSRNVMGFELRHTNDVTWRHRRDRGGGVCHTGGSVMQSYQFEILDQYFSVIVTIPHISIKSQSLCIPTYFSCLFEASEKWI